MRVYAATLAPGRWSTFATLELIADELRGQGYTRLFGDFEIHGREAWYVFDRRDYLFKRFKEGEPV